MKDMKKSLPLQVAEYSLLSHIFQQPAFAWLVPFVIKKRNQIIAKNKSNYWMRTQKFGIKVPRDVAKEKIFDDENSDTLLWDAICKEMKDV